MNIWKHVPGAMPIILAACTAVCTGVSLAGYQEPTFASSAEETTGSSVAGNETPSDAAPSPTAGGEKLKTTGNTKTAAESSSGSATVAASGDLQTYKDGVYTGSAQGYGGTTTVRVTVSGGKITDITVLSENDTDQFFSKAKDPIIKAIIAGQNPDVDTVSGATYSSNGIINAVKNALAKAGGTSAVTETISAAGGLTGASAGAAGGSGSAVVEKVAEASAYKDGTYDGSGQGFGGTTTVRVTISGGKIASVTVLSNQDTAAYFSRASVLTQRIVSA